VVLVTAVTVVLAAVAGVAVVDTAPRPEPPDPVVIAASVDADTGRIVLVHESGPSLDVREIDVRISVGGRRLAHQPSVPFYSARGFASFPSGPFNPVADPRWELGERASLRITGENAARLSPGVAVRIELYRDDLPIATVETTTT
jgi:hypothetical protein